tara:strand:+ start:1005 stop:2630 length:1626 start_codon:yes stop_codon:yes gene_type:complete
MSCKKNMSFEECELAILRTAVDKIGKKIGSNKLNNPEIKKIINIVENFLRINKQICYGGTAINNILPLEDQFYDKSFELPDYDFFSKSPLKDAKKLADLYYKEGFTEVEAKVGIHPGTFKVFVNFIPVADITYLPKPIFKKISKHAIRVAGIKYSPPNFLRMLMYLELSRPNGDVGRWEKVLKRLTLLNKHYPLRGKSCHEEDIQRLFQYGSKDIIEKKQKKYKNIQKKHKKTQKKHKKSNKNKSNKKQKGGEREKTEYHEEDEFLNDLQDRLFVIVRNTLVAQGCVFFGAMANRMYLQDLKEFKGKKISKVPDFDVLSTDPETTTRILKERLIDAGIKNIKIKKHNGIGETLPTHYEVSIGPESFVFIYEPIACHSYNTVSVDNRKIRIATLDTMLSLYLAFIYTNRPYYQVNRILCMSQYLFKVQQKNRLKQQGLLKRFSIDCYGDQTTLENLRAHKIEKYKELKNKKGTREYEWFFLRYIPAQEKINKKTNKHIKKLKKTNKKLIKKIPFQKKHKLTRKKRKKHRTKRKRTFKRLFGF